jgi:hypothetical protein
MKRQALTWGILGFACAHSTVVWAQEAAKADAPSGGLSTTVVLFLPLFVMFVLLFLVARRAKRTVIRADGTLQQMNEEVLPLAKEQIILQKEQIALQQETNRLLGQLLESLRRD